MIPFSDNAIITLKDNEWLEMQRVAGRVTAGALMLLENEVKAGTTKTLLELDKLVGEYIQDNGCSATFNGYKGFPYNCCYSVNRQLVHGFATDYVLHDGDKVSFDQGATYNGVIADSAITLIYGNPRCDKQLEIIRATEEALDQAIDDIEVGKRLGVIGSAIHRVAKNHGYGCIEKYGGHSIDTDANGVGIPHAPPFVANKANPNEGIVMVPGLVLAIEPMFTSGSTKTHVDSDGWTVICDAEYLGHWEHTVFIREDGVVEVTTERNY